jgi:hypothetical protein
LDIICAAAGDGDKEKAEDRDLFFKSGLMVTACVKVSLKTRKKCRQKFECWDFNFVSGEKILGMNHALVHRQKETYVRRA